MTSLDTGPTPTAETPTRTNPPTASDSAPVVNPATARAAMVSQLEADGALHPGAVRDALLGLPLEALMPQAYVRRSADGERPPRWELLDWSAPQDRPELQKLLYGGGSVPVQPGPTTAKTPLPLPVVRGPGAANTFVQASSICMT